MNDYVILTTPVAIVLLIVLVLLVCGFCTVQLLLQNEVNKNKRLAHRNSQLREKLSLTQQELNSRGYHLPEVCGDSTSKEKQNGYKPFSTECGKGESYG